MNWLLVGVLFVLICCSIKGYRKGLLRVVFSLVSFFLSLVFVMWITPYISNFLEKNTQIYLVLQEKCEESLRGSTEDEIEEEGNNRSEQLEIAGIILPKKLQEQLLGEGIEVADDLLESTGIYTKLANNLAHFIVSGISFFIAWMIAFLLLHLISGILNLVSHLPIIHGMNKALGIGAGFIEGLFYVWLFFCLITICCTSDFGKIMTRFIDESAFLTYLYNHNVLLQIWMYFF